MSFSQQQKLEPEAEKNVRESDNESECESYFE